MPPSIRRRSCVAVTSLLLALPVLVTDSAAQAAPVATAKSIAVTKAVESKAAKSTAMAVPGKAQPTKAPKGVLPGKRPSRDFRALRLTWQSNEASSNDRAIYHCVRQNELVGPAYIVEPGEAVRFSCRFDKRVDWPYGVVVYQPAGRRVVVKVGPSVEEEYNERTKGDDVWIVKGDPTGWWRTFIL